MVSLKDKCKLSEAVNGLEESWMLNVLFTQDSGASADVCCLATPVLLSFPSVICRAHKLNLCLGTQHSGRQRCKCFPLKPLFNC